MDSSPHGRYGIADKDSKDLTQSPTDEILLIETRLGEDQFFIDLFCALVGVHLDKAGKGEDEAELQTFQEPSVPVLLMDLLDLFEAVLILREMGINVE